VLIAVANGVVMLVFQALADDVVADEIAQCLEAEPELAVCGRNRGCPKEQQEQTKD